MRLHGSTQRRLADVRTEMVRLREALRILSEQVAHAESVAQDAETRAVVSSTPLADRERRVAVDDVRRIRRERDETSERLDALTAEQDALLDRLLAEAGPSGTDHHAERTTPRSSW